MIKTWLLFCRNRILVIVFVLGIISQHAVKSDQEVSCTFVDFKWTYFDKILRCCEIKTITERGFIISSQPDATVKAFNLAESNVEFLPENIADKFPQLVLISAVYCSLEIVKTGNFKGLPELIEIQLPNNKIERIHENAFRDNTKLENLSLGYNKIKFLSENVFASLIDLKQLFLHNNEIQFISPRTFQNLKRIELISLAENKIRFLDSKTFENLLNIKKISLANNELETIDDDLFKNNVNLVIVWLQNSNFKSISYKTFDNKNSLEYVDLMNNSCGGRIYWKVHLDEMRTTLKENCKTEAEKSNDINQAQSNATIANLEKQLEAAKEQEKRCQSESRAEINKLKDDLIAAKSEYKQQLDLFQKLHDDVKLQWKAETEELRKNNGKLNSELQSTKSEIITKNSRIEELEWKHKICLGLNENS
jgi:Leucine rich repeat